MAYCPSSRRWAFPWFFMFRLVWPVSNLQPVPPQTSCGLRCPVLSSAPQDFTAYLSDGLHLSEKGNQFVAQHLWGLLESRVADLPFILPYWGDIDTKSPENSLLCEQWRLTEHLESPLRKLTSIYVLHLNPLINWEHWTPFLLWNKEAAVICISQMRDCVLMFKMHNKDFYFKICVGYTSKKLKKGHLYA